MTGVQTCALPICFPVTIKRAKEGKGSIYGTVEETEKEIEKLANKSIEEIHEWYYSIKDILIYNQNHMRSFETYECYEEIFEKIKLDYEKEKQWSLQEKKLS